MGYPHHRRKLETVLSGAWTTLYIALIGTIIGLGIGLMIGVIRTIPVAESGWKKHVYNVVNFLLSCYIRNFPWYADDPFEAMVIYYGAALAF